MSGSSYDSTCPRCGGEHLFCSSDYKPYDCVTGECLDCGFSYSTTEVMMSLEHVNERRAALDCDDLPPLDKLAEPTPEGLSILGS